MKVSLSAWALDSYKKVGALRGVARATESIGNVLYEQAKLALIVFRVNVGLVARERNADAQLPSQNSQSRMK
jgi:hypothetical protein